MICACLFKYYSFTIPGDVVSWSVKENIFIIPAVTRELRGRKISCEVSNSVGSSKDQIQLNIACKNKYILLIFFRIIILQMDHKIFQFLAGRQEFLGSRSHFFA